MKIYLAAPWVRRADAIEASKLFIAAGHEITSSWFYHVGDPNDPTGASMDIAEIRKQALEDIEDVRRANVFVVLNLAKSEGKAVETGIALAAGIPIYSVGVRSNIFQALGVEISIVEEALEQLS